MTSIRESGSRCFLDVLGEQLPLRVSVGLVLVLLVCALGTTSNFLLWFLATDVSPSPTCLIAAGFDMALAVALLLRRRCAVELAAWATLAELATRSTSNSGPLGLSFLMILPWGAALAFLMVQRCRLFQPGSARGWGNDWWGATRLTIAVFFLLETSSWLVVRAWVPALYVVREPAYQAPAEFVPGLPTIAVLGSSPATEERVADRPFPRILSERLRGQSNIVYRRKGGINSDMLVTIATTLVNGALHPAAFLIYAGLQDFNQDAQGLRLLTDIAPLDRSSPGPEIAKWVISHSALVRLSLYGMRRTQLGWRQVKSPDTVRVTFEHYRGNLERILQLAAERHMHVFISSLAQSWSDTGEASIRYTETVNEYLRGLPERHRDVTFVDFASRLHEAYPNGRLADCEPFEAAPGFERCGDPYHLGPRGHELLADTFEPVLRDWRPR